MRRLWLPCLLLIACRGRGGAEDGAVDALPQDDTAEEVTEPPVPDGWLWTDDNVIRNFDGTPWQGRGVNLPDTRGCGACMWEDPSADEVGRRMDEAVEVWGATFVRLTLESYDEPADELVLHYGSVLEDPDYLDDIEEIVDHAAALGIYVMLTTWMDPSLTSQRHPTDDTGQVWRVLAERFADDGHVLFGVSAATRGNADGAEDAVVWAAMNDVVGAIRETEDALGTPHHLVSVSGTGSWGRRMEAYLERPIEAGGGDNVVYEMHVFTEPTQFLDADLSAADTLPMIVASFGPEDQPADDIEPVELTDIEAMVAAMDARGVPWLAWTFHQRCPPNLIEDLSEVQDCGTDMELVPTQWGETVMEALGE